MLFNKKKKEVESNNKFNIISKKSNVAINMIIGFLALACVIPFIFVVIISFTSEASLQQFGYKFIPQEWSLEAYKYVLGAGSELIKSYGVTILVTILGTIIGLFLISTYAYVLSRKSFAYKKFFTMVSFIPMLFSGGMVANYLVVTRMLNLKNTIWALILPLAMSAFYVIILRTFFRTSVPDAIIESAKIDGASEMRLFFKIVLPISLPGMATIGLFLSLGYWNDWFNAMMYIDTEKLIPLQYLLMRIENSMEFLANNANKMGAGAASTANMPMETAKMAMVVLSTLPIIFAYPFFQKYFVSGLTIGAVKE